MLDWINNTVEWFTSPGTTQHTVWWAYVTLHDFVQWSIMALLAKTAWGERKKKKELEGIIEHIHQELHFHMTEDSSFHEEVLGQLGMVKGGEDAIVK